MTNLLSPEEAQRYGVAPPEGPAPAEPATTPSPTPAPYPPPCLPGWQRIAADTLLCRGPLLFYGAILTAAAAVSAVFYDGVNANGRRLFGLETSAAVQVCVPALFPVPIPLKDGLYVDVSAAPDDLLVIYAPLPG